MIRENIKEYTVTEISTSIKNSLEENFGYVKVRGEVSNLSKPASGHIYLNLKDDKAIIKAIAWRSIVSRLSFIPEEGLEVICSGRLTTGYSDRYPGRSDYSIIVESIVPAGEGALMALLEKRKKQLFAEGLFNQEFKKSLPLYPETIGVITSPTGAVIKDIIHRLEDRFPCNLILWPVPVQGDDAAHLIADALKGFNKSHRDTDFKIPDVIIVARGGGSIEDLWPFNEEIVVRAVFESKIPVLSAVGHETDTTLIDFVSDLRAPTPTAAAELCTPNIDDLKMNLKSYQKNLFDSINNYIEDNFKLYQNLSDRLPVSLKLYTKSLLSEFKDLTQSLNYRILEEQINNYQERLYVSVESLNKSTKLYLENMYNLVSQNKKLLDNMSYKSVLNRGYSVIKNSKNKIITSTSDLEKDARIVAETSFAKIRAKVESIENE